MYMLESSKCVKSLFEPSLVKYDARDSPVIGGIYYLKSYMYMYMPAV